MNLLVSSRRKASEGSSEDMFDGESASSYIRLTAKDIGIYSDSFQEFLLVHDDAPFRSHF